MSEMIFGPEVSIEELKQEQNRRKPPGFYYLASPYSHEDERVRESRVERSLTIYCRLTALGLYTYPAIGYTHMAAKKGNLGLDSKFWEGLNDAFMYQSCGVIVLMLPGWRLSKGVLSECVKAIGARPQIPLFCSTAAPTICELRL